MANNEQTKQYLESLKDDNIFSSNTKLTPVERDFFLNYNELDKVWVAESYIPKFWRRLEKRNWTCTGVQYYADGTICSKTFTSNGPKGVTITDPTKAKREMTEEQKRACAERMQKMHQSRLNNSNEDNEEEED